MKDLLDMALDARASVVVQKHPADDEEQHTERHAGDRAEVVGNKTRLQRIRRRVEHVDLGAFDVLGLCVARLLP
eukprot:466198-Prorocentrum_minimum.AAC.1